MAEPASEAAGFAQDLFSPLQFCEVVQEGHGGAAAPLAVKDEHTQNPQQQTQQQGPLVGPQAPPQQQQHATSSPSVTPMVNMGQHMHMQSAPVMGSIMQHQQQQQQHVQQHQQRVQQTHQQQQQACQQQPQMMQQQLAVQQQQAMPPQILQQQKHQQQQQQLQEPQQKSPQLTSAQPTAKQQQQQTQQTQTHPQQQLQQQQQLQTQQQPQAQPVMSASVNNLQLVSGLQMPLTLQQANGSKITAISGTVASTSVGDNPMFVLSGVVAANDESKAALLAGGTGSEVASVAQTTTQNATIALPVQQQSTISKSPVAVAVATQEGRPNGPLYVVTGLVTEGDNKSNLPPSSNGGASQPSTPAALTAVSGNKDEVKPVPVKRTWRRPWKKKKEREKRQPVKKVRRVKKRRVVVHKKSVVQIDPRNGPVIDTAMNIIKRESEDAINVIKQKRQRIKLNRNSGREYVNRLGKIVSARVIGSPCNCPLKCWERMGSKILEIFNNFWDLGDFNLQNSYLFTCLKLCDVKRRYTKKPAEESRRQNTFEYFVRISGKHLRVCKRAFMSSHGLTSDKRLRTLFHQMKDGALVPEPDRRGKHLRPVKSPNHLSPSHSEQYVTKTKKQRTNNCNTKKKQHKVDNKPMYTPPPPPMGHIHPHCTPPPPPAHVAAMQEPHHAYIPNGGDIYFPGHYLEPHQSMPPPVNQIPSCQKMLEAPAYFMAGMKENTFHQ